MLGKRERCVLLSWERGGGGIKQSNNRQVLVLHFTTVNTRYKMGRK